jgi:hypothetical protein
MINNPWILNSANLEATSPMRVPGRVRLVPKFAPPVLTHPATSAHSVQNYFQLCMRSD